MLGKDKIILGNPLGAFPNGSPDWLRVDEKSVKKAEPMGNKKRQFANCHACLVKTNIFRLVSLKRRRSL
jgi:hypothetical protein